MICTLGMNDRLWLLLVLSDLQHERKKKATTMVIPTEGDNQNFLKAYHSILISLPNYACIVTGGPDFILGFSVSVNGFLLEPLTCADIWGGDGQVPKTELSCPNPVTGPPTSQPEKAEFTKEIKRSGRGLGIE